MRFAKGVALEKNIQASILKYLDSQGIYSVKVVRANRYGIPDILCCINGKFAAFEVKRAGGKTSKNQFIELEKIKSAGGASFRVYSVEEVKAALAMLGCA